MVENYSHYATAAKIKCIYGTMLDKENYKELLSKSSVSEIADYLSNTKRYGDAFADVDPHTLHRGFLEELIKKHNFDMYIRLCRFQGLDKQPFYDFMIQRREIDCILSMINNINSGVDNSYLNKLPGYVIKHSKTDLLALSQVSDFRSLLKKLEKTPYYKPLKNIQPDEKGQVDYTMCELKLRADYFDRVIKDIDKYYKGSGRKLNQLVLWEIDMINIINAYRMKTYFGYDSEMIKAGQIKHTAIGNKKLESFYEQPDQESMDNWINKTFYKGKDTEFIETRINSIKRKRLEQVVSFSMYTPAVMYAFVLLCDIEATNLIHIIEGIRYGIPPEEIENKLIV